MPWHEWKCYSVCTVSWVTGNNIIGHYFREFFTDVSVCHTRTTLLFKSKTYLSKVVQITSFQTPMAILVLSGSIFLVLPQHHVVLKGGNNCPPHCKVSPHIHIRRHAKRLFLPGNRILAKENVWTIYLEKFFVESQYEGV